MNLLLDTHVFLWFILDHPNLPPQFGEAIESRDNRVYLSVVSIWETIIKQQTGKLPLPGPAATYLPSERVKHEIEPLPVLEPELASLVLLPALHRDPFDRMLIAQSIHYNLRLLTVDPIMKRYPVKLFDASE